MAFDRWATDAIVGGVGLGRKPSRIGIPIMRISWLLTAFVSFPAFAYIDPNTGGMILQMLAPIIAAIAGAWLFAKDYIRRLWGRIFRRRSTPVSEDTDSKQP